MIWSPVSLTAPLGYRNRSSSCRAIKSVGMCLNGCILPEAPSRLFGDFLPHIRPVVTFFHENAHGCNEVLPIYLLYEARGPHVIPIYLQRIA